MSRLRIASVPVAESEEQYQTFALEGVFPANHVFVYNSTLGTLLHLSQESDILHPALIAEQQFTERERDVILPLLTNYPDYAPIEELYASFCYGFDNLSEQRINRAHEHLQEALDEGFWDQELRPMRNVMSRVRFKLRQLGLDTVSMLETGYMLIGNTRRRKTGKED